MSREAADSSKRRRLSQEIYGTYTSSQLSELFMAALYEDSPDDFFQKDLAVDLDTVEEPSTAATKRKREPSPPRYIDLTSDTSQSSSFQEAIFSVQQQIIIENSGAPKEKETQDTNNDQCMDEPDDISTLMHNAIVGKVVDEDGDGMTDICETDTEDNNDDGVIDTENNDESLVKVNSASSEEQESEYDELDESSDEESPSVSKLHTEEREDVSVEHSVTSQQDELNVDNESKTNAALVDMEQNANLDLEEFPSLDIDLLEVSIINEESNSVLNVDKEITLLNTVVDQVVSNENSSVKNKPSDPAVAVDENDSSDDDVFYDVEYEDIDEDGNLAGSQGKQNKASTEGSLDLFKESAINESQIIKAYRDLEAEPLETVVRNTQVKDTLHNLEDDVEDNQAEFQDAPEVLISTQVSEGEDIPPETINENQTDRIAEQTDDTKEVEIDKFVDSSDNSIPSAQKVDRTIDIEDEITIDPVEDTEVIEIDSSDNSIPSAQKVDKIIDMEDEITIDSVNMKSDVNLFVAQEKNSVDESAIQDEDWMDDVEMEEVEELMTETKKVLEMEEDLPIIEDEETLIIESDDEEELPLTLPESLPIPHENTQIIKEHWRDEEMKLEKSFSPSTFIKRHKTAVELKNVITKDKSLTMWWYDASEENKRTIFLFGKVLNTHSNKYVSCCMIVENLTRELYILPRLFKLDENGDLTEDKVTINDVKNELVQKLASKEIHEYTMEVCTKKYAFELPDVPPETEYIKLCYPYKEYKFPQGTTGKTFSHMFGTSVSALEHFIIRQKIMGPCWLKFDNIERTLDSKSWCAVEALVTNPDDCTVVKDNVPPSPPLTIMALSLHTKMNFDSHFNEISAIGGFVCPDADIDNMDSPTSKPYYRFSINKGDLQSIHDDELALVNITKQETESELLYAFLAQVQLIDPDIIVGHNFTGVDLDILLQRMKKLNIANWSRIGRIRKDRLPKLQAGAGGTGKTSFAEQSAMRGRLLCDTFLASQDLVKSKSYHLSQLASSQLNIIREEFDKRDPRLYDVNGSKDLEIARHCSFDAYLSFALTIKLQILPLTKQLTNLSGNIWSRSMNGGRSERNEYLLLHTFNEQNYVCPDRPMKQRNNTENELELEPSLNATNSTESTSYAGGLVLEPKIGFYDKYVLLLDFNSLYPSIMQEYNICFTTVKRKPQSLIEYRDVPSTPEEDCPEGILPGLVRLFVKRRQHVKQLMKDYNISKATRMQYDIEQMALKLTANSMYGCLGSSTSRFYARPLAMLITHKGREILRSTVDSANRLGFNVIYGDTDSIMIDTNETKMYKVKKIGEKLKEHVNKKYKLLEIDVDGYFRHTLLLKKKKYAALLVKPTSTGGFEEYVEVKGLDLVRRDWCELSHLVSDHILKLILSDTSRDVVVSKIYEYLRSMVKRIYNHEFPLSDFIIRKQLTKNLEEYSNKRPHPHVHVAKEMRRQGVNIKCGDVVPYVICTRTNDVGMLFNEPCIPESCSTNENLDIEWYLSKQILPPVNRLCAPIEGIDLNSLLICVGLSEDELLKKAKMVNTQHSQEDKGVDPDLSIYMEDSRYCDPESLYLDCSSCFFENEYHGPLKSIDDSKVILGLECEKCGHEFSPARVRAEIQSNIIRYINKYYGSGFICDQVDCDYTTRFVPLHTTNCPTCAGGLVKEYTAKMLYTQILQLRRLFDTSLIKWDLYDPAIKDTMQARVTSNEGYKIVKDMTDSYLSMSDYKYVNISEILRA